MRKSLVIVAAICAFALACGLAGCASTTSSAESPSADTTEPAATEAEQAAPEATEDSEGQPESVNPSKCSDELYEARLDAQHYMLDVLHTWEQESFFFETCEEFEAAYQARVDELNARCDESCDIIDSMSDPDVVKEYYKDDIRNERDQYMNTLQEEYDRASANYA